jgi:putative endonuclease
MGAPGRVWQRGTVSADAHPPHVLGRWGEERAAGALEARGWRILARNYRFGRREVDIVALRGDVLAFVEVKTRAGRGFGEPEEAVTALKRREIEAVARDFVTRYRPAAVEIRFDVVAIVVGPGRRVERMTHVPGAWMPSR